MTTPKNEHILAHSYIPRRYIGKGLNDMSLKLEKWVTKAKQYVIDFNKIRKTERTGIYIVSPTAVGVGKTHLACGVLRGLILSSRIDRFASYFSFGELIRAFVDQAMGRETEEQFKMIERVQKAEVLVLDDIDKFSGTANAGYRLHQLINRLWDNGTPAIITSNLAMNDLIARIEKTGVDRATAASIVSRLAGMCQTWTIELGGLVDFRTG